MNKEQNNQALESKGRTVQEAIDEALLELGARRDEVEIEVLDEGKEGLLGVFGRRSARVLVTLKRKRRRPRRRSGRGRSSRGDQAAPAAESRDESAQASGAGRSEEASPEKEPAARRDRSSRGTSPRTRSGRTGSSPDAARADGEAGRRAADDAERERKPRRRSGRRRNEETADVEIIRAEKAPAEAEVPRAEAPAPAAAEAGEERPAAPEPREDRPAAARTVKATDICKPEAGMDPGDVSGAQRKFAGDLMRLCGFPCRCEVVEDEYNLVKIVTDEPSASVLVGRHGRGIESLEILVERLTAQVVDGPVHMNLDINNFRRRRQHRLADLTRLSMQKVRNQGEAEHLPPLNARERRIVHMTVAESDDLSTVTEGYGPDRHVVILPGKPDEESTEAAAAQTAAAEAPADETPSIDAVDFDAAADETVAEEAAADETGAGEDVVEDDFADDDFADEDVADDDFADEDPEREKPPVIRD